MIRRPRRSGPLALALLAAATILAPSPIGAARGASASVAAVVQDDGLGGVPTECRRAAAEAEPAGDPTVVLVDLVFDPCGFAIPAGVPVGITLVNNGAAAGTFVIAARSQSIPPAAWPASRWPPRRASTSSSAMSPGSGRRVESGSSGRSPPIPEARPRRRPRTTRRSLPCSWIGRRRGPRDAAGLAALMATPVRFRDMPTSFTVFGDPSAVAAGLVAGRSAFADTEIVLTGGFATAERAAATGVVSARYVGQLAGLPPGTGQPVGIRFAALFEMDADGRITDIQVYYDLHETLVALGAAPSLDPPVAGVLIGQAEEPDGAAPRP